MNQKVVIRGTSHIVPIPNKNTVTGDLAGAPRRSVVAPGPAEAIVDVMGVVVQKVSFSSPGGAGNMS